MLIRMDGDCTVGRSEEIRDTLVNSLNADGDVELDLGGVTSMDLSFCQIIHSLKRACAEKGVEMAVSEALPEEQTAMAVLCGLPELAGRPACEGVLESVPNAGPDEAGS